ncbi:MAG: beta-ketoacyl-ACP synthase 3 [Gemmatimonadetes bacterium]|nr:beta-ketoacyl-ACP synthase 3 [Gemmatimonadota bacterium]
MSDRTTAAIAGTGSFLPADSIDNFALYEMGTLRDDFDVEQARGSLRSVEGADALSEHEVFDRWARQVTGIKERRYLTPESGLTTEDMCARAGQRALEAAGMEASELDLIFAASLTGADEVPNVACTVAERIGAPQLGGYVLNAACAGFVHAIGAGWSSIVSGMAERVLVVSGDALTRAVDYTDVRTAVVFGDGAGAVVLERSEGDTGLLGRPVMASEFSRAPLYMVGQGWEEEDEPFPVLHMHGGPRILRNAITKMAEVGERALETASLSWRDVDFVIPHQANLRITKGLEKHLDLESGHVIHNIERYGNMSASTVAVAFDEVVRGKHGPVPEPATYVLTAIGGGYTMAGAVVRV